MEVESANKLLELNASQVHEWIEGVKAGEIVVPKGFNWELVSEGCGNGIAASPEWRRVGILVNEYLANKAILPSHKDRFMQRAMFRRVNLVHDLGNDSSDSEGYANQIINWFFSSLPVSLEEAKTLSEAFFANPSVNNEILELRGIKNRLRIVKQLPQNINHPRSDDLAEWLKLTLP